MFTSLLKIVKAVLDSRDDMGVRIGVKDLSSSEESQKSFTIKLWKQNKRTKK